jgi:hypothetical protein
MYHYAKGHTFETVMAAIRAGNKNRKATVQGRTQCLYLTADGNKCFIGCFIPEGHESQKDTGAVLSVMGRYPELIPYMPIQEPDGLRKFQYAHDDTEPTCERGAPDLYTEAENWLRRNVTQGEPDEKL